MEIRKIPKSEFERNIKALEYIRDFYYVKEKGRLLHRMMCDVFRCLEFHGFGSCNCGLIFELVLINDVIAERIHPKFHEEHARDHICWHWNEEKQEYVEPPKISEEEKAEWIRRIDEQFPNKVRMEYEEDDVWDVIQTVFGEEATQKLRENYIASSSSSEAE